MLQARRSTVHGALISFTRARVLLLSLSQKRFHRTLSARARFVSNAAHGSCNTREGYQIEGRTTFTVRNSPLLLDDEHVVTQADNFYWPHDTSRSGSVWRRALTKPLPLLPSSWTGREPAYLENGRRTLCSSIRDYDRSVVCFMKLQQSAKAKEAHS